MRPARRVEPPIYLREAGSRWGWARVDGRLVVVELAPEREDPHWVAIVVGIVVAATTIAAIGIGWLS